jgi:hypothetical protein
MPGDPEAFGIAVTTGCGGATSTAGSGGGASEEYRMGGGMTGGAGESTISSLAIG